MEFKKYKLKNGLRVILAPLKSTETVNVLFMVGTGSKYETKQNNGVSHFLEHLVFKGTKKRKTPKEITAEIDAVGGELNAFTGEEYTGYWTTVNKKHFSLGLDFISDITVNSTLPPEEIEKERGVILEEINMYEDLPMRKVEIDFMEVLYGDQPAGRSITGPKEVIKKITRQEIIKYRQSQYVAPNSVLVICGNLPGEKEVLKQAEKLFGLLKNKPAKNKLSVKNNQKKPALKITYKETDQTHLIVGFKAGSLANYKDRYPLSVLVTILGGYMSARLFQEIREKRGWAYYVHGYADFSTDAGSVGGWAGVLNNKATDSVKVILKELKKIKEGKFTKKEVETAKNNIIGRMSLGLEGSQAIAEYLVKKEILEGKILTPEQIFDKIKAVSPDDIKRVAQKYFVNKGLNLALIGPHKDKKQFEKVLRI